jgi:hypothetical protein
MDCFAPDTEMDVTAEKAPGFHLPFAIAAPVVALMIAIFTYCFSLNARLTALETLAAAPSKYDAQFATITTKLSDFEDMYERDRINDKVAKAREEKQ